MGVCGVVCSDSIGGARLLLLPVSRSREEADECFGVRDGVLIRSAKSDLRLGNVWRVACRIISAWNARSAFKRLSNGPNLRPVVRELCIISPELKVKPLREETMRKILILGTMAGILSMVMIACQLKENLTERERALISLSRVFDEEGEEVGVKDIDISDSPFLGPEDADVVIIEFMDLQCPYCKNAHRDMKRILKERNRFWKKGRVKFVFKNSPLDFHDDAMLAHQAAMAASQQGKFWEYLDMIFDNQGSIKEEDLIKYAGAIGLDLDRFERDWKSQEVSDLIQRDLRDAADAGVEGTPSIFVNGREGRFDFETLNAIIKRDLYESP